MYELHLVLQYGRFPLLRILYRTHLILKLCPENFCLVQLRAYYTICPCPGPSLHNYYSLCMWQGVAHQLQGECSVCARERCPGPSRLTPPDLRLKAPGNFSFSYFFFMGLLVARCHLSKTPLQGGVEVKSL